MPKSVTVYTADYCPYCRRAKDLLKNKQISFKEVNLSRNQEKREKLEEETGWMTVPMIFIGDEFIGGFDELHRLDAEGQLEAKINS